MKACSIAFLLVFAVNIQASQNLERARQLEDSGDGPGARALLAHAAQTDPHNIAALTEYAEFLDGHSDPAAIEAYDNLLAALDATAHRAERAAVARRMVELYLLAGDRTGALRSLEIYKAPAAAAPFPPRRRWLPRANANTSRYRVRFPRSAAWRRSQPTSRRRPAARPGAQRGHQRLPGRPQQRSAGTDRIPQACPPLSLAGARIGETGRPGQSHQGRDLRFARCRRLAAHSRLPHARRMRQ